MIRLQLVGDGPLDDAILPPLVENLLETKIEPRFKAWRDIRLHSGRGYGKKLRYMIRRVMADSGLQGVIAVVDRDKDRKGQRIRELREIREGERSRGVPAAVGEAIPHGEAWLLDDWEAVKSVLELAADASVPADGTPKEILTSLHSQSNRASELRRDVWGEIARQVQLRSCRHSGKTGFKAFADDVAAELGPLTP